MLFRPYWRLRLRSKAYQGLLLSLKWHGFSWPVLLLRWHEQSPCLDASYQLTKSKSPVESIHATCNTHKLYLCSFVAPLSPACTFFLQSRGRDRSEGGTLGGPLSTESAADRKKSYAEKCHDVIYSTARKYRPKPFSDFAYGMIETEFLHTLRPRSYFLVSMFIKISRLLYQGWCLP